MNAPHTEERRPPAGATFFEEAAGPSSTVAATPPHDDVLPKARAFKVTTTTRARTVTVVCPYCRRTHVHGWPFTDPSVGTRVSHCHDARAGQMYLVVDELDALARWEGGRW